jgi:hypothetical protein
MGIVAVMAAGCGAAPQSLTPATQQTTAPSSSPSAAREVPDGTVDLAPGRYARTDAVPGVTFEVEDGWSSETVGHGYFEIRREVGDHDVIVTIATVSAESAGAVARGVQATPGLSVLASSDSRMSGLTGPNLELENTTDTALDLTPNRSGVIDLEPGDRAWLSLFDTAHGVLAIAVTSDAAAWDDALLAVEPFLESVVIEP